MIVSAILNLAGLAFGMRGSYIIWKYGLPPMNVSPDGTDLYVAGEPSEEARKKTAFYREQSKCGMTQGLLF
jgi:hypothetical protein